MQTAGGEMPARFFEQCGPRLEILGLGKLGLTGSLPRAVGKLEEVKSIILHGNKLSGELPAELGECKKLRTLLLFANDFSGSVPKAIGECSKLSDLRIRPGNSNLVVAEIQEQLFEQSKTSTGHETSEVSNYKGGPLLAPVRAARLGLLFILRLIPGL
eukprot:scaffold101256_cov72-Phaeocystis_antarctica.AAC.10